MRPDHLYFLMTMIRHACLAGAFIYAAKVAVVLAKAF
jgi:hypothetical protein